MFEWLFRLFHKSSDIPVTPRVIPSAAVESYEISPIEVQQKREEGKPLILVDVRESGEWEKASLVGALRIPREDIYARYSEISSDPGAEIVVFCHHGIESEQVMHQLWGLGFQNARVMSGGLDAWSVEIDPKVPRY